MTVRVPVAVVFSLLCGVLSPRAASAQNGYTEDVCGQGKGGITLSVQGGFILLRGGICPGDDDRFRTFIKTVDPSIRTVRLISGGGNGGAAQGIGEIIRKAKFDTYVNGAVDRCASSCTFVFAAGVERFYPGARDIVTDKTARRGLGFHYVDAGHFDETEAQKARKFDATAPPYLKRMLSSAAANAAMALMRANHTAQVTWLNGDEALRDGIATSLDPPR